MLNLKLRHKGLIIVALPVILTAMLTIVLLQMLMSAETQLKKEAFAAQLISVTSRLQTQYYDASGAAYLYHMTRSELQKKQFDRAVKSILSLEKKLKKILVNNEREKEMASVALQKGKLAMKTLTNIRKGAPRHLGGDLDSKALHAQLLANPDNLGKTYKEIIWYGKSIEKSAPVENAQIKSNIFSYAMGLIALNIVLAIFLAFYFTRSITSRLNVISENALKLAASTPMSPPVGGSDEIKKLDMTIREMAILLEESRRKEKSLADNAVNVLASIDSELKFVNLSPAATSSWGYQPEELIGSRIVNILEEDSQDRYLEQFSALIGTEEESTFDTTLVCADGKVIDARWAVHWSHAEEALFCVITDITEEKKLQQLKQRLMDTVAHDLRTPLSSIKATLNLINMGVLGDVPDKVIDRSSKAEEQSERLIRLINDLLDFEKLESGGMKLNLEEVSLDELLTKSIDAVAESARQAHVTIEKNESDATVQVDQDRLIQVIVNLLGNAIKYSDKKSKIKIVSSSTKLMAQVKIIDTGPGIPENQIEEIFERFKMVDKSSAHKKPGTGLGLAIAKEIIEMHGGTIGVKNNDGPGCTFWFTAPIAAAK